MNEKTEALILEYLSDIAENVGKMTVALLALLSREGIVPPTKEPAAPTEEDIPHVCLRCGVMMQPGDEECLGCGGDGTYSEEEDDEHPDGCNCTECYNYAADDRAFDAAREDRHFPGRPR